MVAHVLTDAQVRQQERRIRAFFKKWRDRLWLHEWHVDLLYFNGPISEEHFSACAVTDVRWEYRDATIKWNLEAVATLSDEKLEWVLVHEAMHILVNEMRESGIKHEERVCSSLATIILSA